MTFKLAQYAYVAFPLLPLATWLDVTDRFIPSYLFYSLWIFCFLLLAERLINASESHSRANLATLGSVLLIAFSIAIILTERIPANIIDSLPSTPETAWLAGKVVTNGVLPSQYYNAQYLSYPLSIVQLSELELTLGTTSSMIPKLLQVGLILIPPVVIYGCLNDKRIGLIGATIGGLSPWILDDGTHYSPEADGGILFAIVTSVLIANLIQSDNRFILGLSLMGIALALTDVFYGFIWIVLIIGLSVTFLLLRNQASRGRMLRFVFLASALTWGVWYLFGTGSALVAGPISAVARLLVTRISVDTAYLVSSSSIPFWISASEYAAYFSLGVCAVIAIFVYLRKLPVVSAAVVATAFVSLAVFLPWVAGYQWGTDLAQRSYFIFQVGTAIPIAYLLASTTKSHRRLAVLCVFLVLMIVPWNGLAYGGRPYQYVSTFPYSNADTRFNLESWNALGNAVCQYSHDKLDWGVRLGAAFVTCTGYGTLSPESADPKGVITVNQLTRLDSALGPGRLVALRFSLQSVNEWAQPLPEPFSKIISAYDVVFDCGDPVLVYTL